MAGKITALKVQARNRNRVNVYVDGRFAFGLARITAGWLQVGQPLSDAEIETLLAKDTVEVAHERALKFLSYRPRSEAEVRRNLKSKGVDEPVIETVVTRLKEAGLVDDATFAKLWLENRSTFRPKSRRVLRAELRQKGVSAETAEDMLTETADDEAAERVARARAPRLKGLPREEFLRKLGQFLARRGFDYETISPIVERLWHDVGRPGVEGEDSET